ncbi:hypothetical protein AVEN_120335-1 [Araneus ventricosus]|uniref:Uncharacterized protein n=1 Tax=Araneus ventricosus TaxID=182803 RepID=A0A4Y2P0E3_ARAVE|nr:hypothetical protein AVEN_120335-1 [Araneus ventricosus]
MKPLCFSDHVTDDFCPTVASYHCEVITLKQGNGSLPMLGTFPTFPSTFLWEQPLENNYSEARISSGRFHFVKFTSPAIVRYTLIKNERAFCEALASQYLGAADTVIKLMENEVDLFLLRTGGGGRDTF